MPFFDPFNPLVGITPRFTEEQLEEIDTWFNENAKPNLLLDDVPTNAVSIEAFMKFLSLKKYHRRSFRYPSYFDVMAKAEMLRAGTTRLLTREQIIYMLNLWVVEPEIRHELHLAFKLFDTENRNYLEIDDIKAIVSGYDDAFDEAEILEVIRDADINGDGRIIYEEFIESMFSISPELYEDKVEYLYDDPDEDPSVEPEPQPEPEPEPAPAPVVQAPPEKGKKKK